MVPSKQRKRNLENYVRDITGNQPGQLNQKGQLVYHPAANKPWDCSICQEQLATNKLFGKHVREKHQKIEFFYFCECGYSRRTANGTGQHKSCDENIPSEHKYDYKCELCPFSSQTENGVLVHRSVAHKAEYNEGLKEKENYRYTEQVLLYLARIVRQLKKDKTRDVNKVAGERLGRTTAAIAKIRTKTEYKQAERQVKKEEEEHNKKELQKGGKESRGQNEWSAHELTDDAQELTGEEQDSNNKTMVERRKQDEASTPKTSNVGVPPTPFEENLPLSQMLLNQQDLNNYPDSKKEATGNSSRRNE